jgi:hypothetical protein
MSLLANSYGDAGINTAGGYIFTTIVMLCLIAWVVWIYVHNFGPAAKERQASKEAARRTPHTPHTS